MKLDTPTIEYIQNVVNTAKIVGIDTVIIEPGLVRALADDKSVAIIHPTDVPDMPFGAIGLSRLDAYTARYNIVRTREPFYLEAITKDQEDFARSIIMKGKGTKIEYRCGDPVNKKIPTNLKDPSQWSCTMNEDAVDLIQRGLAAMKCELVSIISNQQVSLELVDVNNDVFSHTFNEQVTELQDGSGHRFAFRYPAKLLLSVFKHNPTGTFTIGAKGTLCMEINGLQIYVLARV